nr:hypothetical protein [uncultured Mediterranean phage uvMED]|tara:strand:+ start:217 stop:417 length:201 start_codon:yes stop_codon:yes gene_type:complete
MTTKTTKEKTMTNKAIMEKSLEIFDKHFPKDKNMKMKEKKSIVKFFLELHKLGIQIASNGKWYVKK